MQERKRKHCAVESYPRLLKSDRDRALMHAPRSSTIVEEPACPLLLAAVGIALLFLQIANDR
jgi:hypothetical protein